MKQSDHPPCTRPRRSLLFTPANRSTAFDKAIASGTDIVCIDLEDAVPPGQKAAARAPAIDFLAQGDLNAPQRALRINAISSLIGLEDLTAVLHAAPRHGMIVLPKVSEAAELRLVDTVLSEVGSPLELGALIETLDGLENIAEISKATPRLKLMIFGAIDFSAELGTDNADQPLAYARGKVVHAAKRAEIDVMDVPSLDFRDLDSIGQAAQRARHLGFTGKAAIHPMGIDAINGAFTPSAAEIAYAKRVISAYDASPNGLAVLDGRLVEAPVVKAMQRRLAVVAIYTQNRGDADA